MFKIIVELFLLVIISAAITPFIRRLAFVLGAVDNPNARRVNKKPMPTIGGLGIFVTFNIGTFVLLREQFPTHEIFFDFTRFKRNCFDGIDRRYFGVKT